MAIQIGTNFEYKGESPNFERDQFETLKLMRSADERSLDEGHISYCIETGKHYVFNKNNTADDKTGKWRLLTENPENLKSALDLKADKSELDTKVDKVEGKSLISDTEIDRLKNVINYDDTDVKTDIADIKTSLNNKLESTDLNDINAHVSNTSIHITAEERVKWNAKIDDSDLVEYEKTSDVNTKLESKANATDLNTHTGNTDIHVTSDEKTKWDSKLDSSALNGYATETFVTEKITEAATSGKVDLTGYATTIEVDNKLASKADKTEIPDISNLATKDELSTHADNSSIHITASEKIAWNNKLDTSALDAYTTTDDLNSALALKANKDELFSGDYNDLKNLPVIPDTSNFATKGQLDGHINNTTIHVTTDEKDTWNAKLDTDALDSYVKHTELDNHINNNDIHITAEERTEWTAKPSGKEFNDHVNDSNIHVTTDEKNTWNAKLDSTDLTVHTNNAEIHVTTNDKNNWNSKADGSDFITHKNDTDIHVTADEKTKWDSKLDNTALNGYATETFVTEKITEAATSGKVDLTDYAKTAEVDAKLDTKVDKIDGKGLSTNDYTTDEKTKVEKIKTDGNGKEFLANDGNYVGIYSKKEIDDLLYPILNPYEAPIVNLSASNTLFKVGTTNLVTFTANITKGRDDITSIKFVNGTDTILKEITDKTELAKTTQTYTLSMTTTGTVKVIVSDGISTVEKSVTVTYTYDSYYGIISGDKTSLTSNEIKSLNTKLTTSKSFKYDEINLDNQKIAYAYLKSRGALTKILDANNFDYLNSYTRSEVNIDGQEYYLYILTKATIIDGFKQIYQ